MKTLINRLLKLFIQPDSVEYIEIRRNEPCYCGSGKKYKSCHFTAIDKQGKIALYETDKITKTKTLKIYSKSKYKGTTVRFATGLRGVDVRATNVALDDHNPEVHDIYKL